LKVYITKNNSCQENPHWPIQGYENHSRVLSLHGFGHGFGRPQCGIRKKVAHLEAIYSGVFGTMTIMTRVNQVRGGNLKRLSCAEKVMSQVKGW